MEEKGNNKKKKDFAFTKRQISFMYEYWYGKLSCITLKILEARNRWA